MAVADRLVPMITEVTPVNERIMRLRIFYVLVVIPLFPVYASNRVSELSEAFYAERQMVVVSCPKRDTLIILGDGVNATTGTDSDGNSALLLDFGKKRRRRTAGSWIQSPDLHR